jgi:hypothetical protein
MLTDKASPSPFCDGTKAMTRSSETLWGYPAAYAPTATIRRSSCGLA